MTIILFVSLLVAELLVPYLQYALIKTPIYKLQQEAVASGKKKFSFSSQCKDCMTRSLPYVSIGLRSRLYRGVLCVAVGSWIFISRPFQLMPIAERNQFAVEITMPTGTSVERTSQVADSLERILASDSRVVSIASFHGCSSPRFQATYAPQVGGPNFAQFIVNTKSNAATIEVLDEYTGRYENAFPDAFVRFKQLSYSNAAYPIEVRLSGHNMAELEAVADTFPYSHAWDTRFEVGAFFT